MDICFFKFQVRMVTENGLVIFCWGDDNNDEDNLRFLKELGVHALIYDKIDQYSKKQVKESVFLVEARETQRQLLVLAAGNGEAAPKPTTQTPEPTARQMLDVDRARQSLSAVSTATTLASLQSEDYNEPVVLPPDKC